MSQPDAGEHRGDPTWLVEIGYGGSPGLDVTESARTCASVAQHHNCGRAAAPALTDIGTRRFLADGMKPQPFDAAAEAQIGITPGHLSSNPSGFSASVQCVGLPVVQDATAQIDEGFPLHTLGGVPTERPWMSWPLCSILQIRRRHPPSVSGHPPIPPLAWLHGPEMGIDVAPDSPAGSMMGSNESEPSTLLSRTVPRTRDCGGTFGDT
jgi:hypothetical protein